MRGFVMGKDTKNLIFEVSLGIVLFTAAACLLALVFFPQRAVFLGLLLGMVLAIAMFLSMAVVLEGSMRTEDPKTVQKRSVISAVVRYLVLIIILVTVIRRFEDQFNPVAVVIGVLGLKAGAYLQPVIHRAAARGRKAE